MQLDGESLLDRTNTYNTRKSYVEDSEIEQEPIKKYFSYEHVYLTDEWEPSFMEAIDTSNKEKWLQAMEVEIQSLEVNHTYDLVKLPEKKALKNK